MALGSLFTAYSGLVAGHFEESDNLIIARCDPNGVLIECNRTMAAVMKRTSQTSRGNLLEYLSSAAKDSPAVSPRKIIGYPRPRHLRLYALESVFTSYLYELDDCFILFGERIGETDLDVMESLSLLNNEVVNINRELKKKNLALQKANEKIEQLTRLDPLTGLANRRFLSERLPLDISAALRHGRPLSLIMLDLDHFKSINDDYGHAVGDQVLKAVGGILSVHCRLEDLGVRFGGEEFLVLLPHTALREAENMAERIRLAISHKEVLPDGRQITASLGATEFIAKDTPDSFIKRADDALYRAKSSGRNRTVTVNADETA